MAMDKPADPSESLLRCYTLNDALLELDVKKDTGLGSGAFGAVYQTRYDGMDVAAKCLSKAAASREFEREVELQAQFRDSPHILKIIGVTKTKLPDFDIVVTELMTGTLQTQVLAPTGTWYHRSIVPRLQMLRQIAAGLAVIHEPRESNRTTKSHYLQPKEGCVHGDLKPANVLLDADGNAKIADFGFARVYTVDMASHASGKGIRGTPVYRDPWLLISSKVETCNDIYSFGIMAWELLTGGQPYPMSKDETVSHFEERVERGERPDILALFKIVPFDIVHMIQRCWHAKPRVRPTAQEIIGIIGFTLASQGQWVLWSPDQDRPRLTETPGNVDACEITKQNLCALSFRCANDKCRLPIVPADSVRRLTVRQTPGGDAVIQTAAGTVRVSQDSIYADALDRDHIEPAKDRVPSTILGCSLKHPGKVYQRAIRCKGCGTEVGYSIEDEDEEDLLFRPVYKMVYYKEDRGFVLCLDNPTLWYNMVSAIPPAPPAPVYQHLEMTKVLQGAGVHNIQDYPAQIYAYDGSVTRFMCDSTALDRQNWALPYHQMLVLVPEVMRILNPPSAAASTSAALPQTPEDPLMLAHQIFTGKCRVHPAVERLSCRVDKKVLGPTFKGSTNERGLMPTAPEVFNQLELLPEHLLLDSDRSNSMVTVTVLGDSATNKVAYFMLRFSAQVFPDALSVTKRKLLMEDSLKRGAVSAFYQLSVSLNLERAICKSFMVARTVECVQLILIPVAELATHPTLIAETRDALSAKVSAIICG